MGWKETCGGLVWYRTGVGGVWWEVGAAVLHCLVPTATPLSPLPIDDGLGDQEGGRCRRAPVVRPACSLLAGPSPLLPPFHFTFLLVPPSLVTPEVGRGVGSCGGEKHETELFRCRRRRRDHEGEEATGWDG